MIAALRRFELDYFPINLQLEQSIAGYPQLENNWSYELEVDHDGIGIKAVSTWGAITACSTLAALASQDGTLPHCVLSDEPAYPWRGLMIDTSRHFIPIATLKETIELMSCYRLNTLHLNLSNDQACRFASESYSRLAAEPHYTRDELASLVDFAADRAIRIVPELDVPGHTTSWVAAYPAWGAGERPEPSTQFGVHEACLDPTRPEVLDAVKQIFTELCDIFPDQYIHLGGDEVNSTWWDSNAGIQRWMKDRGMQSAHELQTWFVKQLNQHLALLGKRTIGWDEILAEELPQEMTIQAWRGANATEAAIRSGHTTIVSSPYYLDLFFPADYHYRFEPSMSTAAMAVAQKETANDSRLAHIHEGLQWQFDFGKVPPLARRHGGRTIGGEACMWSEMVDADTLHTRVWSRMPAIAERLWAGARALNHESMYRRLECSLSHWGKRWQIADLGKVPANRLQAQMKPLIEQLEPIKWYARLIGMPRVRARTSGQVESSFTRPYDIHTKLDRLVDFLPPESLEARRVVASLQAGDSLGAWCEKWKRQAADFEHGEIQDQDISELRRLSRNLLRLAEIYEGKRPADMSLADPVGEYLIPVAAPILHDAIRKIAAQFGTTGSVREITKGYINDTFVIGEQIVLQRINARIFDVSAVLSNRRKLDSAIHNLVPSRMIASDGQDFVVGVESEIWRATPYIEARSFDVLPVELCVAAGEAFGCFLTKLQTSDKRPDPVILGFHDINQYLQELDAQNPTSETQRWFNFVNSRRSTVAHFNQDEFQVIHGDCKVNNLLFELTTPHVKSIVDLDTMMWGHPAWDFGDLVRSTLTRTKDLSKDRTRLRMVTKGFKRRYRIDSGVVDTFAQAPAHMSFMLGVRFLADHLRGDSYFKVVSHGDNLTRAVEQFELSDRLTHLVDEFKAWIQSD